MMLVGQPQLLKNINTDIVRDLIFKEGPISKPEIAERTELSLPTVKKRVDILLREGWIKESGRKGERVGRKAVLYEADRSHNMILMLYKTGGFTGYLVDITGMIHFEKEYIFQESDAEDYTEFLYKSIQQLKKRIEGRILLIGVTVPGVVRSSGMIKHIPEIPEWEKFNLQEVLQKYFETDVLVENDIRMSTLGYYDKNVEKQVQDMVYIFAERALSAGIVIDGRLHRGFENFAGELGFLVVHEDMKRQGQLQESRGDYEITIMNILKQLESDPDSFVIQEQYYELLAKGIISVSCVLAPEMVVIQGKQLNESALDHITEQVRSQFPKDVMPQLRINTDSSCDVQGMIHECMRYSVEKSAKLGDTTIRMMTNR